MTIDDKIREEKRQHDINSEAAKAFFPYMMMFTSNKTTKYTCNSTSTTIYCAAREKSKFKMLSFNNN